MPYATREDRNRWMSTPRGRAARRRQNIRSRYGLTEEQYDVLIAAGCGVCRGVATDLDHSHRTGRVRKALCRRHNLGLGCFDDDPALLRRAADYLEEMEVDP